MILTKKLSRQKLPALPWQDIKDYVLGPDYELSLVFCGDKLSRRLNRDWRKKDKPTNILSFPLEKNNGEIFINLKLTHKQWRDFPYKNYREFLKFLFIHGLLHLKGMDHSSKMDRKEKEILEFFSKR